MIGVGKKVLASVSGGREAECVTTSESTRGKGKSVKELVELAEGLEPSTGGLQNRCSAD